MQAIKDFASGVELFTATSQSTPTEKPTSSSKCECDGTGWVSGLTGVRPCDCLVEREVAKLLPARFWGARLSDFPTDLRGVALGWLRSPTEGMFITGSAGVGKTHLLAALVFDLVASHRAVLVRKAATLYREVRQTFGGHGSEGQMFEAYQAIPFLALDDIGAGGLTDFERRTLLEILDWRTEWHRPTVVTTNWTLAEISEKMDDRIGSRLAAYCRVEMRGRDWRTAPTKEVLGRLGKQLPAVRRER